MNPIRPAAIAAVALLCGTGLHGQNIVLVGGLGTQPAQLAQPAAPATVVYSAPVAYAPASHGYAPPVYHYAPPVYHGGADCTPNVTYIGGAHSYHRNYYSGYGSGCVRYSSPVVYFGRGEAWQRGYHFTRCR